MTRRDVVVVGAGVGGLAAAARLAAAGHRVTVVEQADGVGGKLGLHEVDGYRFDTGPSLVTLPWTLADTLAATGVSLEEVLALRRLDPIARYRFGDGTWLDADADDDVFAERLEQVLHPGAGVQWRALMARAAAMWDASAERVLRQPIGGPADLLRLATSAADVATIAPHRTLRGMGREYLSDPRLRDLLDRYATYTGSDPRRAPAALLTVPWAERRWGGWYVEGGLRRIAEVLADRVRACGGEVRTGVAVTAIHTGTAHPAGAGGLSGEGLGGGRSGGGRSGGGRSGGGRSGVAVTGVGLADGTHLPADVVVANADAAQVVADLLPTGRGGSLRRRLRVAPRSLSGWVLLLGVERARLSGAAASMAHHTVLFPRDYEAEFDALFRRPSRYVADPTIYIAAADDPAVAPPGHQAWFVMVNAPRTDQVPSPPPGYGDRVLRLMAERGVDVTGAVRLRVERTPADLERETRTPGGAIYGTSSNGPLAAFLRPPNVVGDVDGLHLVGGSSHPGGGLPLVMLSAEIVSREVALA